jgi:hypothetical protein
VQSSLKEREVKSKTYEERGIKKTPMKSGIVESPPPNL